MKPRPHPTKLNIEIGRRILRNWCHDNNLAIEPVAASDLVHKIAESLAVLSDSLTTGFRKDQQ